MYTSYILQYIYIYNVTGDLLLIKEENAATNSHSSSSFSNLKVGDIVIFKTPGVNVTGRHETVVHRVAEIRDDTQGNRVIRTKGDANPSSDNQRRKLYR